MSNELKEFPIIQIKPKTGNNRGYNLLIQKKNGGNWIYSLRNELNPSTINLLKQRQADGWDTLAIAKFRHINKLKGNGLHLEDIGI